MSDGAMFGVGAEEAMKAAIGGGEITKTESVGEMRDRILGITFEQTLDYDGSATYTAKIILTRFLANPALANHPTEAEYKYLKDGEEVKWDTEGAVFTKIADGLWDVIKPTLNDEENIVTQGLSGFQWGWAVNAARRCVELPSVPNPAIITVGSG